MTRVWTRRLDDGGACVLDDHIKPAFIDRARALRAGRVLCDWPEVYVLARALTRRLDVYDAASFAGLQLPRCRFAPLIEDAPRWCVLREPGGFVPMLGAVPNVDVIDAEAALQFTVPVAPGPASLFASLSLLGRLGEPPLSPCPSPAALLNRVITTYDAQAQVPYLHRDAKLMHMLALMPTRE